MTTFRASSRVHDRAAARRFAAIRRMLLVGVLAGAVLLSSTLPAGAAEPPAVGRTEHSTLSTPLRALLAAVGELVTGAQQPVAAIPAKTAPKTCRDAGDGDVPTVVAAIFRCRLREAGFSEQEVGQWTAEAVLVSKCESKWDPKIVVFDGKYLDAPHPRTGYRYSAAGVFQFIRKTADKWIEGGYRNVKKPRYNIDAAARLFIHNRQQGMKGWEDWACAAANDGFKDGSVLPNYPGGPSELPDWVWEY